MAVKIAINGFGRIGVCVARIADKMEGVELVAINNTASPEMTLNMIKFDSVHGKFDGEVKYLSPDILQIGKNTPKMFNTRNPQELPFGQMGVDVVLECTGAFLTRQSAEVFIKNGVKKVIFSAPAKDDTATFVLGVNEDKYKGEDIISNASCTTNCLGPIAKIINDAFGIEKGLMTTIHAYTNGQSILDSKSKRDLRRARAAAINMIPTTTGAAKAISKVIPSLEGKMHGQSVRVPVPNVSMVDLNVLTSKNTTKEELNELFIAKSRGELKGILCVDEEFKVSQDFQSDSASSTIALDLTQVVAGNMVKVMSWYDNEWGYSTRLIEMAKYIAR